jgi:hypothetical protein
MKRQCVDRKKARFSDAELTGGREKTPRGKAFDKIIKFNRVYASDLIANPSLHRTR